MRNSDSDGRPSERKSLKKFPHEELEVTLLHWFKQKWSQEVIITSTEEVFKTSGWLT